MARCNPDISYSAVTHFYGQLDLLGFNSPYKPQAAVAQASHPALAASAIGQALEEGPRDVRAELSARIVSTALAGAEDSCGPASGERLQYANCIRRFRV